MSKNGFGACPRGLGSGKRVYENRTVHGNKKDAEAYLNEALRRRDLGGTEAAAQRTAVNELLDDLLMDYRINGKDYAALHNSGASVPQDISIVGCNDTEGAAFQPALTSVREFPEELGRHLADFALRRIQDPIRPAQQLTIPTQLVLRDSVQKL